MLDKVFGRNAARQVEHRGLMVKMLGELLGGRVEAIIVEQNIIVVNCGSYALKYMPTGTELVVKKTGNEAMDILLSKNLAKEFKAVSEGEQVYTTRVGLEPKIFNRVEKVYEKTRNEYSQFISQIKGKS